MKKAIVLFILFGLLAQNFSKLFIVANFEMNRAYIAKNLCVKKAEPENCCKGSCHLKKQLDSDDKKQEGPDRTKLKSGTDIQFFQEFKRVVFFQSEEPSSDSTTAYSRSVPDAPIYTIFHPPVI